MLGDYHGENLHILPYVFSSVALKSVICTASMRRPALTCLNEGEKNPSTS